MSLTMDTLLARMTPREQKAYHEGAPMGWFHGKPWPLATYTASPNLRQATLQATLAGTRRT